MNCTAQTPKISFYFGYLKWIPIDGLEFFLFFYWAYVQKLGFVTIWRRDYELYKLKNDDEKLIEFTTFGCFDRLEPKHKKKPNENGEFLTFIWKI